jgi:hypothetical protein
LLSVIIATSVEAQRIRLLPPTYNYPYNLHGSVSPARRAKALNDLVSFTYEDRSLDPQEVRDIDINEPLRGWLLARKDILP